MMVCCLTSFWLLRLVHDGTCFFAGRMLHLDKLIN
jgi:hypothetical protein